MKLIKLLFVSTFMLFASVAFAGPAEADANQIVGGWFVKIVPDIGPPFLNLATFGTGGTMATVGSFGEGGSGNWRRVSGRDYAFTFVELLLDPASGELLRIQVRGTLTLDKNGDEWSTSVIADFFTQEPFPNGVFLFSLTAAVTGERIQIQ